MINFFNLTKIPSVIFALVAFGVATARAEVVNLKAAADIVRCSPSDCQIPLDPFKDIEIDLQKISEEASPNEVWWGTWTHRTQSDGVVFVATIDALKFVYPGSAPFYSFQARISKTSDADRLATASATCLDPQQLNAISVNGPDVPVGDVHLFPNLHFGPRGALVELSRQATAARIKSSRLK